MSGTQIKKIEENRKIQVTGGSTFILSLPKKWVQKNQIKKGDSVFVREEENGSLSIDTLGDGKLEKKEETLIRILPTDNTSSILRKTVSTYLIGYTKIRILTNPPHKLSPKLRNELKNFVRQFLVGTEILTDTSLELALQVLLDYRELSMQNVLKRMAIITSSMHKDAMLALEKMDKQIAKSVIATDSEVDRFSFYMIRQTKLAISNRQTIKAIGLKNERDCLGYRLITKSIERTADHAAKIAEYVSNFKHKPERLIIDKIKNLSNFAVSMFDKSIIALFERNYDLADKVSDSLTEFARLEKDLLNKSKPNESADLSNIRLLLESVIRTAEYASDIAEVVLNLNVESILS
ncbi:AbrB/MazE/SpoVT family DNA-binding domain-containing protein [Candidatus Bathyarchaeota archaeon]|nr:AbrB/MazE/SpoVT family DNA-binding domain-containing protein [Candidatus Bathyarchaeota archaeon]